MQTVPRHHPATLCTAESLRPRPHGKVQKHHEQHCLPAAHPKHTLTVLMQSRVSMLSQATTAPKYTVKVEGDMNDAADLAAF